MEGSALVLFGVKRLSILAASGAWLLISLFVSPILNVLPILVFGHHVVSFISMVVPPNNGPHDNRLSVFPADF